MTTKIRTIFLGKKKGVIGWPPPDFDSQKRVRELERNLSVLKSKLNFDVEFVGNHLITDEIDVSKLKESIGEEDGLLVITIALPTYGYGEIMNFNIPKVAFIDLYGAYILHVPPSVIGLSSSDFNDIGRGLKAIDTVRRLKESKILCVGNVDASYQAQAKEKFGIEIKQLDHQILVDAYEAASEAEAEEMASELVEYAEKVMEPTREDIVKSTRMYIGIKKVMEEEKANAITVNCLGLTYAGALPIFPCVAFSKLNDEGLTGVCEADLASTLTQMLVGFMGSVPGFVSDPVIDTATNTVVHCHCVAATRMGGVEDYYEPYVIRSHSEDNKGVSLQVKMRMGQKVTHAKLNGFDEMLVSTGEIIGNVDIDKGCRTKVAMKIKDATQLYEDYRAGLHRVMFYGDLRKEIKDLGKLLGFKVVEEG